MFSQQFHYYFILRIGFIFAQPQVNLYYTNEIDSINNYNHTMKHSCLRIVRVYFFIPVCEYNIIYFGLNELPSKFHIDEVNSFRKFAFANLLKNNIISQQLFLWTAPIDLIEKYQFYLNQLSTSTNLSIRETIYYNCSLPKFGPICQYELEFPTSSNESLSNLIRKFYNTVQFNKIALTCYIDLNCNYKLKFSCLDWTEICDGKIDCLNDGIDEEHCWQLEINQCKDNELQCNNGQCIPRTFFQDYAITFDCLDRSDKNEIYFPSYLTKTNSIIGISYLSWLYFFNFNKINNSRKII